MQPDDMPSDGPLGCGEFLRTAGYLGVFVLGGIVFGWVFGSDDGYPTLVFFIVVGVPAVFILILRPLIVFVLPALARRRARVRSNRARRQVPR